MIKAFRRLFRTSRPVEIDLSGRGDDDASSLHGPDDTEFGDAQGVGRDSNGAAHPLAERSGEAPARTGDPAERLVDLLDTMQDELRSGRAEQERIEGLLTHLPSALEHLPEMSRRHRETTEAIGELLTRVDRRDEAAQELSTRIEANLGHHTEVLGLIQQQLDLNHQVAHGLGTHLERVGGALDELSVSNRESCELISTVVRQTRERDERMDRALATTQGWMIGIVILGGLMLIVSGGLAWIAIERAAG